MIRHWIDNPEQAKKEITYRIGLRKQPDFDSLTEPIRLYLGCGMTSRRGYVGVDINPPPYGIQHDLLEPFPLDNESVESILTEDTLEHLEQDRIVPLLNECHRILKPGGIMRIGVPDYGSPQKRHKMEEGHDPDFPDHSTFTRYSLLKSLLEESNFEEYEFKHYWDNDVFHYQPVDYSKGFIKRAVDNKDYGGKEAMLKSTLLVDIEK